MSLSIDEDADCLLDELIAQFLEIADRGNLESAHSLIARYPQYRDELTQFQRDHERIVERRRAIELSRTHDGQSVNATVLVSAGDQSDATITYDPDRIEKHGFPVEFGRYRIERPLAKGAMGSIYVAIDTLLGRTIALKIPRFQGDERELAARFLREARSAAALNHRSICPIFDFGEIDGQQYLSMPLIEGHALSTAMANRSWSQKQIAQLIRQLAIALAHAHQRGVIHRDVKPSNILVDRDGEPVITDFGLARCTRAGGSFMTPAGAVVGTPAYMAPEQIRGDADVSPAIDQYSLGVLMYELMTGRIPFEGSLRTVLSRTLNDAPEDPMRIRQGSDPGLSQICLKLLAKRSVDRFPSMSELATALDQWEPDTQLQSDRSRGSSNRFRAIAASVILGMAIIGVNLLIRNSQSTERARLRLDLDPSLVDKTVTLDGRPLIFGDSRSPFNISSGDHEIVFKQGAATVLAHKFRVDANETTVLALCLDRSRQVDAALTSSNGAEKLDASTAIASVAPQALKVAPLDISPAASKASKSAPVGRSATEIRQAAESKPRWQSWPPESPRPAVAPFSAEQAARLQSEWAAFLKKPVSFQNSLGMTFRLIPPGEYDMGSSDEEVAESLRIHHPDFHEYLLSQKPRHLVVITQPFYVGACEVTQKDYLTIMGSNPSYFSNEGEGRQSVAGRETSNHPVDSVSWNDCIDFCNALSVREQRKPSYSRDGDTVKRLDGAGYTLPSEAEWEYVCRAGTTTRHWIGNREEDLVQAAWFNTNSGGKSHPVGQLKANPFGLFDVHGSLWEWVDDEWQNNYYSLFAALPAVDPTGPAFEVRRKVLRGGVCLDPGDFCRSAFRLPGDQNIPHSRYGFRISILASSINNQ